MIKMKRNRNLAVAKILLFIIYAVGVIGIGLPQTRVFFIQLTPYTLLISAFMLFMFHNIWSLRFVVIILIIAGAGLFIEVLGVHTAAIFGSYSYGSALGKTLWEVPLVISVNWLILVYCSYLIAGKISQSTIPKFIIAALIMVSFDLIMEPVAIKLDMWNWKGTLPPLRNYLAWFMVSFLFVFILHQVKQKIYNPIAEYLLFYLVGFFGILNFVI